MPLGFATNPAANLKKFFQIVPVLFVFGQDKVLWHKADKNNKNGPKTAQIKQFSGRLAQKEGFEPSHGSTPSTPLAGEDKAL